MAEIKEKKRPTIIQEGEFRERKGKE